MVVVIVYMDFLPFFYHSNAHNTERNYSTLPHVFLLTVFGVKFVFKFAYYICWKNEKGQNMKSTEIRTESNKEKKNT